jgi:hypothetical protein
MKTRLLLITLLTLTLSGCLEMWTRIDSTNARITEANYTLELPPGWVRNNFYREGVALTQDGLGIQMMDVSVLAHDKAFPKTKRKASADLLPAELAEMILAEYRADPLFANLAVLETAPTMVSGQSGVRVKFTFKNPRGVAYQREVHAAATPTGVALVGYQAIARYYWERDYSSFQQFLSTLRLLSPTAAKS